MLCFMSRLGIQWYAFSLVALGELWESRHVYVIYCTRCVNAVEVDAFFLWLFLMDVEHGFRVSTMRAC